MAEILYRLVREVEANPVLFEFVWGAVVALDGLDPRADSSAVANFHLWFMVGLARHLGFFPGNEWVPGSRFDIREGVFVRFEPPGPAFSPDNSALLGRLMTIRPDELGEVPLNRRQRGDFLSAMLSYFGYHLDAVRDVRSVDILREVF
jgi:DNA repair protein RecO (recombination protein O)